jgi:hypothetical protein
MRVPPPENSLKLFFPEESELIQGEIAPQKEGEKYAAKPLFLHFLFGR